MEGSTGSGPGVGQWAAQRTQAAATRTLARRRASRSRFTWLCLYEVELLGELEAERLRDVWGSLSSGCGCHLTPAPLKIPDYIKKKYRFLLL